MTSLRDVARECDLVVVASLNARVGEVAHVRDVHGRDLVLKGPQQQSVVHLAEPEALRAWADVASVPAIVADLGSGWHLREYLDGERIDAIAEAEIVEIARVAALLHAASIPRGAPTEWLDIELTRLQDRAAAVPADARRAADAHRTVARDATRVLVHGDFYPGNFLRATAGIHVIDPLARADDAAADMAALALTIPGDLAETMATLRAAYPGHLRCLDAYVTFLLVRNRHYRDLYERRNDSGYWQPCHVADGDGARWTE